MDRCIPIVIDDGTASDPEQAVAICSSLWDEATKNKIMSTKNMPVFIPGPKSRAVSAAINHLGGPSSDLTDLRETQRAYSILNIKAVNDDLRIIEGIATTPSPDRMGDVIETDGIEFKLPLPLLYQHNSDNPIGHVVDAKVSDEGIRIKAKVLGAGLDMDVDKAWNKIKHGLVPGLSIGFRAMEYTFPKDLEGIRFIRTEWLELSVVTVPANAEATILNIKTFDQEQRALLGVQRRSVIDPKPTPTVVGTTKRTAGAVLLRKSEMKKTIQQQITEFENKRAATMARMTEIMAAAEEEGRTLTDEESQEHDTLKAEIKTVDAHLIRLKDHEQMMTATATSASTRLITPDTGLDPTRGSTVRGGTQPIQVRSAAPQGIGMARVAICLIKSKISGGQLAAWDLAKKYWPDDPGVEMFIRTAVEAADTTTSGWASQLVPSAAQLAGDFLDLLRPATIIGRIPGLRFVPFNVAVPVRTAGGTFRWVGEAVGKPVTSETFASVTLRWAKAAGIVVITQELARFSSPAAEGIIRDSMVQSLVRFFDTEFVSTNAAVSNVSPAGILNGISAVTPTGTTSTQFRIDMANMLDNFTANNVDPSTIVILMSASQALRLSLMVTTFGTPLFPGITNNGGTILGFPVVVSENVGTKIIALSARDILIASDPGVNVSVSDQASVEMDTVPAQGDLSPITDLSTLKSLWQNNLIGIRVEQFLTWTRGRTAAVEYINGNAYVPS
jgi:HK97 family phage major capsid protein/HK97 family phage prohead protease